MQKTLDHLGCQFTYSIRGDGHPVLLIQGVGAQGDAWLPQVEKLASNYRCLTFDNRGMGKSQPTGTALTVEQMAQDAKAILDAEGIDRVHLVGHSLGGLIALQFALSEKRRVQSLSLLCTFANGRAVAPLSMRMIWLGLRTKIGSRKMRRRAFLRLVMPSQALKEIDADEYAEKLSVLFGHDLADQPPIVSQQLKAMRAHNVTSQLKELHEIPTLVVSGFHDPIAPPKLGQVIANGIPNAKYIEIPDASHGVPIQFPDRINSLLERHFGQTK